MRRRPGPVPRGPVRSTVLLLVTALCGLLIGLSAAPNALAGDTFQATPRAAAAAAAAPVVGEPQPSTGTGPTWSAAPNGLATLATLLLLLAVLVLLHRLRWDARHGRGRRPAPAGCRGPPAA
jgi:hypothetical protein